MIEEVSDSEALFDARVSIRDVNDTLDLDIEDEDFDTLGGLLYHELGKVPERGRRSPRRRCAGDGFDDNRPPRA